MVGAVRLGPATAIGANPPVTERTLAALDDGGSTELPPSNLVSYHTQRKATTVYRILCKKASHAVLLSDILAREGHRAVWFQAKEGPAVATDASVQAILDAVSTTETILRVPTAQRTRRVEVQL